MRKRSKFALAAAGLAVASGLSFVLVAGLPAATPTLTDLTVGRAAPDFRATDANGRTVRFADYRGKTVVLEWNNPKCPTVKDFYGSGAMQKTQAAATSGGAAWLTINSSGPWRQGHMNGKQAKAYVAAQKAQPTAYLLDPEGDVGKSYGAKTTPHVFVINADGALVYRGAVYDGVTEMRGGKDSRNHVLAALGELKAGKPVSVPTSRPFGCAVKYKG